MSVRRALLLLFLTVSPGTDFASPAPEAFDPPKRTHVATLVVCNSTPGRESYALAIGQGYARILDPAAAPATCVVERPSETIRPPEGFEALLVLTFDRTDLDRPSFHGTLKLVNRAGRWAEAAFIAQRRKVPVDENGTMEEKLALTSAILPLAYDLNMIPDPFPNSPPGDLPSYDATIPLPPPPK